MKIKENQLRNGKQAGIGSIFALAAVLLAIFAIPALGAPNITASVSSLTVAKGDTGSAKLLLNPNGVGISIYQVSYSYDKNIVKVVTRESEGPYSDDSMDFFSIINPNGRFATGGTTTDNGAITILDPSKIVELSIKGNNTGQTIITVSGIQMWGLGTFDPGSPQPTMYLASNVSITINVVDPATAVYPQISVGSLKMTDKVSGVNLGYAKVGDQVTVLDSEFDGTQSVQISAFNPGTLRFNFSIKPTNVTGARTIGRQTPDDQSAGFYVRIKDGKIQASTKDTSGVYNWNPGTGGQILVPYQTYRGYVLYNLTKFSTYLESPVYSGNYQLYSSVAGTGRPIAATNAPLMMGCYSTAECFEGEINSIELSEDTATGYVKIGNNVTKFDPNFNGSKKVEVSAFNPGTLRFNFSIKPTNVTGARTIGRQTPDDQSAGFYVRIKDGKIQASTKDTSGVYNWNPGTGGQILVPYQTYRGYVLYNLTKFSTYLESPVYSGNYQLYSSVAGTGRPIAATNAPLMMGCYSTAECFEGEIYSVEVTS